MTTEFKIDSLPLGAGSLGLSPLPGRAGDAEGDLAQIGAFAPDIVLSLTTEAEMAAHGVADLPNRLSVSGISWHAFPIGDFGIPTPEAERDWKTVAAEMRETLDRGGRVLIHCKAGLGRTGMVALRLMVETGEDPETALERLRAARPGTVETEAQKDWAAAGTGNRPAPDRGRGKDA